MRAARSAALLCIFLAGASWAGEGPPSPDLTLAQPLQVPVHSGVTPAGAQGCRPAWLAALLLGALDVLLLGLLWRRQRRVAILNATTRAQGAEIERRAAHERQVLDALAEGVFGVDREGRCTFVNPATLRHLGYEDETELLGRDMHALIHGRHADGSPYPRTQCPVCLTLQDGMARQVEEEGFWRKDGTRLPISLMVSPLTGNGGGAVVAFHDIRERLRLIEALRHQASHDELTGLANRRHLFEAGERELARIRRGHAHAAALIMLDVDFFKQINDNLGHLAGDAVLRQMGQIMRQMVRKSDIAGRYGGEEFILLLPDTGPEEALRLAERLREAVAHARVKYDGHETHFTVSLGITALTAQDASLDEAIARADRALYRAKRQGRNAIELEPAPAG